MKINLEEIQFSIYKTSKASKKVDSFVAYYILQNEDGDDLKMFVTAKGYGGGGVNEMCEVVANFSKCGRVESYQIFDYDDENHDSESPEIFSQMWDFIYNNYIEVNCDDFMTYKGKSDKKLKIITSEEFYSDDLLEEISENWGLFLKFR